jgi:uncharacterized protein (TIGR00369 family)
MPRISIEDFNALVAAELPFAVDLGMSLDKLGSGTVIGRLPYQRNFLRPGDTIAGPMLVALADYAMYALVLSVVGRVPLAVTTNLNINFLRRPGPHDVIADGRVIKGGKRLVVSEVTLFSEGGAKTDPVAHITGTYSVPPRS